MDPLSESYRLFPRLFYTSVFIEEDIDRIVTWKRGGFMSKAGAIRAAASARNRGGLARMDNGIDGTRRCLKSGRGFR